MLKQHTLCVPQHINDSDFRFVKYRENGIIPIHALAFYAKTPKPSIITKAGALSERGWGKVEKLSLEDRSENPGNTGSPEDKAVKRGAHRDSRVPRTVDTATLRSTAPDHGGRGSVACLSPPKAKYKSCHANPGL